MVEGTAKVFFDWLRSQDVMPILLFLNGTDILSGIIAAFITKTVSSDMSLRGGLKKVMMWMAVGVSAAVGKLSPEIPLMNMAAAYFCITESLSFIENLGRAGVPVPPILREALSKLNQVATTTTTTTTTATVTATTKTPDLVPVAVAETVQRVLADPTVLGVKKDDVS